MLYTWQYTSWTNKAIKLLQLPKTQNINQENWVHGIQKYNNLDNLREYSAWMILHWRLRLCWGPQFCVLLGWEGCSQRYGGGGWREWVGCWRVCTKRTCRWRPRLQAESSRPFRLAASEFRYPDNHLTWKTRKVIERESGNCCEWWWVGEKTGGA